MFTSRSHSLFPLLLVCLLAALPARAQNGTGCPNRRATYVPSATSDLPPWRWCYLEIEIFGHTIQLPWSRCPTGHTYIPAHLECLGQLALGLECEDVGFAPIWLELCRCVPHAGHGTTFSSCECRDAGAMGFVTTGQTHVCH